MQLAETLALSSLVIGALVRLVKSDSRLPVDIPARWRPLVAALLGVVAGVLDLLAEGEPLRAAVVAVLAPSLSALGHGVIIESLRGGREVGLGPLARTLPDDGDGPPKPKHRPTSVLLVLLVLTACSPSQRAWIPGMAQVDQAGIQIARIMHWCDEAGVEPGAVRDVRDLYLRGEPVAAAVQALTLASRAYEATGRKPPADIEHAIAEVVDALIAVDDTYRAMGVEPPPEHADAVRQVVGHALGSGLRAVSGGS